MKKFIFYNFLSALFLITFNVSQASANDSGFYLGANIGTSIAQDACDEIGYVGNGVTIYNCDDTDVGVKLTAGYQFNKYFGVEAFYANLGEASADAYASIPSYYYYYTVPVHATYEADGFGSVATASIPINDNLSFFAKAGAFWWNVEATVEAGYIYVSEDDDGVSITVGLGAQYFFTDYIGVQVAWDRFSVGDDATTGESDVDLFSGGVAFRF